MYTNEDMEERIIGLEKANILLNNEIEHIKKRVDDNTAVIKVINEEQEGQELSLLSLKQSRSTQQKLHTFLLSLLGALLLSFLVKIFIK